MKWSPTEGHLGHANGTDTGTGTGNIARTGTGDIASTVLVLVCFVFGQIGMK